MKVLHVGHTRLTDKHPDYGKVADHPGRWVLNHAMAQKGLHDMEVEVLMHVPGASQDWSGVVDGVTLHCLKAPNQLRAATLFYFDARRLAKKINEIAPDIVHAHGTEDAYALAAQRSGFPYLMTAQGMHFMINEQMDPPLLSRQRVIEFTEEIFMRGCRDVITKSKYVLESIQKRYPNIDCHLVPNTFDPRILDIDITNKKPNHFVFVGVVDKRKGVHLIADALEKLPNTESVTLSIVGNGGEFNTEYEVEHLGRLRDILGDRLILHGHLESEEVYKVVSSASFLLAPSLEEMFGNQLIEALLLGTSGIVSSNTAMAENVRKYGNGVIFENGSGEDLGRVMTQCMENPTVDEVRSKAREYVANYLGPQIVASQHKDLYNKIIHRDG